MYEQLYAAWRREIDDYTLGGLPPDFYVKIADYLVHINEEKIKVVVDKKTVKTNLLEHEAFNVERMLKELLNLRYRKILKTVTYLRKVPLELLADEEAKNCESFLGFAVNYQEFAKSLMLGQQTPMMDIAQSKPQVPESDITKSDYKPPIQVNHKRLTLRFTKAIPAIMGADMKSYGPFQAEDVASMPMLNAQILIKQGLAILVDVV